MRVIPIKTQKVTNEKADLLQILDRYLLSMKESLILAITSKIVAICEGRIVKVGEKEKINLIKEEADYYLPSKESKYGLTLTIKNNLLLPDAGIDESNGNGYYVLHPLNPQKTANKVRAYLCGRFHLKQVGVIITDSKTNPLRWGVIGAALAHSGFSALNNYIGLPDIFGRKLKVTKVNVADALAVAAVLVMGEGAEQTPLALISDLPFVKFTPFNPKKKEIKKLKISLSEDLYAPLLKSVVWRKGGRKS